MIVMLGKGGVGRTTASFAVALLAAARGMRTLLMETDPETPIAAAYGQKPGLEPVALESQLWALFLGGQESLEDYLGLVVPRPILRAVFATSLYQYFVHAAPALRELTMMGKIFHEIERRPKTKPPWDVIVVDAPASGQSLAMLRMPFAARESFGDGIVGSEAGEVSRFFRDPTKCAIVVVTTSEALVISESLEIHQSLQQVGLTTAAVMMNRAAAVDFESAAIAKMMRRGARHTELKCLAELADLARAALKQRNRERRAIGILERQLQAPIAVLSEQNDFARRDLAAALAHQLAQ